MVSLKGVRLVRMVRAWLLNLGVDPGHRKRYWV
jgi:hypothetical protein